MRLVLFVIATLLVASALAQKKSYRGYKVFRFRCQNEEQFKFVNELENNDEGNDVK